MTEQPKWVWALWRAANRHGRGLPIGWYWNALHQAGYSRSGAFLLRRQLAYMRHGWLIANRAGRAELKRRGFVI